VPLVQGSVINLMGLSRVILDPLKIVNEVFYVQCTKFALPTYLIVNNAYSNFVKNLWGKEYELFERYG